MAMIGVSQPVTETAKSKRPLARAGIVAGSAGATVVPTRLLKFRSNITVAAPFARIWAGTSVPDETARIVPGSAGTGASWPAKSTQIGPLSGMPQESAYAGAAASAKAARLARTTKLRFTPRQATWAVGRRLRS